jgi:glycosyltransferase involved in cell wall biosynthesis
LNQTFTDWECIVVDDGSTDNSASMIGILVNNDSRFKVVYQENLGVAAARNNAIKVATGEFILPLDGDDYIALDYLERCYETSLKELDATLIYGKAFRVGIETRLWELPDYSFNQLLQSNVIHCSAMYRKSDWLKIGGYDVAMSSGLEDWEFWIHLLNPNTKVVQLPEIGLYYRIHKESRNTAFNDEVFSELKQYIGSKHASKYQKIVGDLPSVAKKIYKLEREVNYLKRSRKNAFKLLFPTIFRFFNLEEK